MSISQVLRKLSLVAIGLTQITTLWAHPKTIAVLPFTFKHSEPEPKQKVINTTQEMFEKAGLTLYNSQKALQAWENELKFKKPLSLPDKDNLIKLGQKLKVDYVCAGVVRWTIKTPWVLLGPKTKAICKVNYRIVDVANKKVVLNTEKIADSTKKESGLEIAGDLLVTPLATIVSGGPKVPHMNRSGQIATLKALSPFVKKMKSAHCSTSCCTHTKKVTTTNHPDKKKITVHTETTTHTK